MQTLTQSALELIALYEQLKSKPIMDALHDETMREKFNDAMLKLSGAVLKMQINQR